jgi:hypothetical protein
MVIDASDSPRDLGREPTYDLVIALTDSSVRRHGDPDVRWRSSTVGNGPGFVEGCARRDHVWEADAGNRRHRRRPPETRIGWFSRAKASGS